MNTKFLILSTAYPRLALIRSIVCGLALLASGQAFAAAITSAGTGNWNNTVTWSPAQVPTSADTVTIANTHIVTVDVNAAAQGLVIGGTLNFSPSFTLDVGANGISNQGTFNATGAGAITSAATAGGTHGIYNTGTFTMGSGTLTSTASNGVGIENNTNAIFTGGTGLITAGSFRNGNSGTPSSFTVGSGGMTVTPYTYMPNNGTIVLNGNVTIAQNINAGTATVSGAGKMILTDAAHSITGAVNVHNLETAAFTAARTLTLSGTVTATGTTKLNGSAAGAITLSGGTFTPATTAYYCAASTTAGITCNAGSGIISAPIDFSFNHKQPEIFATEVDVK